MSPQDAKKVIKEELDAKIGRLAIAVNVLALPENDGQTTLSDWLLCLERGNKFPRLNVVKEVASLTLYRRTNRTRNTGVPYESLITDVEDWRTYLIENGFTER